MRALEVNARRPSVRLRRATQISCAARFYRRLKLRAAVTRIHLRARARKITECIGSKVIADTRKQGLFDQDV